MQKCDLTMDDGTLSEPIDRFHFFVSLRVHEVLQLAGVSPPEHYFRLAEQGSDAMEHWPLLEAEEGAETIYQLHTVVRDDLLAKDGVNIDRDRYRNGYTPQDAHRLLSLALEATGGEHRRPRREGAQRSDTSPVQPDYSDEGGFDAIGS